MKTPPIITKPKAHPLESKVEAHFKKRVTELGGISYKFNSKNMRGVSDQIMLYKGVVTFVEIKRVGGKLTKLQHGFKAKIDKHGGECVTCYGHEGVDAFIDRLATLGKIL